MLTRLFTRVYIRVCIYFYLLTYREPNVLSPPGVISTNSPRPLVMRRVSNSIPYPNQATTVTYALKTPIQRHPLLRAQTGVIGYVYKYSI